MKAKESNMRYLRLYFSFLKINLQSALAYRNNFLFGLLITGLESFAIFITITILFNHIPSINEWSYSDMMVLIGIYMVVNGLSWVLFRASVEKLDHLINRGDFDNFLVKPISSQFLASFNRMDVEDAARGVVGIAIIIAGFVQADRIPTLFGIIGFIITLACAEAILYSLQLILKTISFKFVQGWGSNNIFYRLQDTAQFPLTIYRGLTRLFFTLIIPMYFVTTVPAQLLLGKVTSLWLLWALLAATISLVVTRAIWHHMLKSYSSASS